MSRNVIEQIFCSITPKSALVDRAPLTCNFQTSEAGDMWMAGPTFKGDNT